MELPAAWSSMSQALNCLQFRQLNVYNGAESRGRQPLVFNMLPKTEQDYIVPACRPLTLARTFGAA